MNKRIIRTPDVRNSEIKLVTVDDACMRYSLGRNSVRKLAEDAGAVVRIGRSYRVNCDAVDRYIDTLSASKT